MHSKNPTILRKNNHAKTGFPWPKLKSNMQQLQQPNETKKKETKRHKNEKGEIRIQDARLKPKGELQAFL